MSENQHITNGDDPVKPLAWVKREDGVPELNTEQKGLTKREYFASQNQDEISQSDAIILMGHKPPEQNTLDYFIWKSEAQARANVIHSNSLINALNENLVEDVSQKKEQQIGLIAGHVDDISYPEWVYEVHPAKKPGIKCPSCQFIIVEDSIIATSHELTMNVFHRKLENLSKKPQKKC